MNRTNEPFDRILYPEIFVGLVAPIGVELQHCRVALRQQFEAMKYRVIEIKVTDAFDVLSKCITPKNGYSSNTSYARLTSYIEYGNKLRSTFTTDYILAAISILRLVNYRVKISKLSSGVLPQRTVYVLYQFKRREEIDLLRSVYGRCFFQLSVYSRRGARVDYLSTRFAQDSNSGMPRAFRDKAEHIVQIDENEVGNTHGQRISDIFHDADAIINHDVDDDSIDTQVKRFCALLFGSNAISPTKDEYGMFAAKAAALRSLDLSRQVGAAIFTKNGEILSMGSNEVPRAGGGTYWSDDKEKFDDRDYARGYDANDRRKKELLDEILGILKNDSRSTAKQKRLRDSQFMDALEYGRIIHAEMSAIVDAARIGRSILGATLYVTTFPCHMCAKHIVGAGIERVVFLEPYPKSLTAELHADSTRIEGGDRGKYSAYPAVEFVHFHGISPRRYRETFERTRRKDKRSGRFQQWVAGEEAMPLIDLKFPFYLELEKGVVRATLSYLKSFGVNVSGLRHIPAGYDSDGVL